MLGFANLGKRQRLYQGCRGHPLVAPLLNINACPGQVNSVICLSSVIIYPYFCVENSYCGCSTGNPFEDESVYQSKAVFLTGRPIRPTTSPPNPEMATISTQVDIVGTSVKHCSQLDTARPAMRPLCMCILWCWCWYIVQPYVDSHAKNALTKH